MYKHFRAHTPEFSDLAALQAGNAPLGVRRAGSQAPADNRNGQYVSGNFFRTLGINPWIGYAWYQSAWIRVSSAAHLRS
jgi:putative ABC transport system permease protein